MKKGSSLAFLVPLLALLASAFIVSFLFPGRSTPAEVLADRPALIGPCSAAPGPVMAVATPKDGDSAALVRAWMDREAATGWEKAAIRYFALMRDNYAGYGPSGGDERFRAAFLNLAEDLAGRGDSVDAASFAKALAGSLSFLSDRGFTVQGGGFSRSLAGERSWYTTGEDWLLEKRGAVYRFLSGPMAGADIAPEMTVGDATLMVRPTIDREGRVAWRLVASRSPGEGESPVDLCLDVPARRLGKEVRASMPFIVDEAGPSGNEEARSGSTAACGPYANLESFAERMPELRAAPVFVFDLRDPADGRSGLIDASIASFCGTDLPLCLRTLQTVRDGRTETDDRAWQGLAPHLNAKGMLPRIKGPNKVLVILMDRQCGANAEAAIRELSALDGALLVGMPAAAMSVCGDTRWYRDDGTGTGICFGSTRFVWHPRGWRDLPEGQGIEPDLWVPTAYARERAETLVARYGADALALALRE
jgi:hypothetical protein